MIGPQTTFSDNLHADKYRMPSESFQESMDRIANCLKGRNTWFHSFREMLLNQRFLPSGRIQATIGTGETATYADCFTSPTIGDSLTMGDNSILGVASKSAEILRMGGEVTLDLSTISPRGSLGPSTCMGIYDSVCKCVKPAGGVSAVLRIDHPDIMEFIYSKQNAHALTSLSTLVGVTDDFMVALQNNEPYDLQWDGQVHGRLDASEVWEALMRSAWDWAEPGVMFLDKGPIAANSTTLSGSLNLVKYLYDGTSFDWHLFEKDTRTAVRALDAMIDINQYPLPEQRPHHRNVRSIRLGITAAANCLETMGMPYGSEEFLGMLTRVLEMLNLHAYRESIEMAKELGAFPRLNREKFLEKGTFASGLPGDVQEGIRLHGIRNSHLTGIGKCGTISLCADNISSGIEPVFLVDSRRIVNTPSGPKRVDIVDYGMMVLGTTPKTFDQVTIDEHLNVLLVAATNVDSTVSKTLDLGPDTPWEDFQKLYIRAWQAGVKGCTTFNTGGLRMGLISSQDEGVTACHVDPKTGEKSCD